MPVDELGIRADIVISPESVFNRMNSAQFYEQFLNRACYIMQQRVIAGVYGDDRATYKTIIEFLTDIRPVYGKWVDGQIKTADIPGFIENIRTDGIYLTIPGFCTAVTLESCTKLSDKWDIGETPVTYKTVNRHGEVVTHTTKVPVMIGSKYVFLLGKIPVSMLSAIEVGYVNQFGTPAKAERKEVKAQCLFKQTPMRLGEDEIGMLTMSLGQDIVARFMGKHANSPEIVSTLARQLLTEPSPSTLSEIPVTTSEVIRKNANVGLFEHLITIMGYDVGPNSVGKKVSNEV